MRHCFQSEFRIAPTLRRFAVAAAFGLIAPPVGDAQAQSTNATIYYGNAASFGSSANDPGSFQGFTQLRDRWTADGCPAVITDVFPAVVPGRIFFATAPTTAFNAVQVAALQVFLANGGVVILSHDGGALTAQNQLLSDLGSSMVFGPLQGGGTQNAQVVANHAFTNSLPIGSTICTFSPGQITGGTALVDFPLGTHIISYQSVGGGTILAVADFDILNNVPHLFFPPSCLANIVQFWDNICGFVTTPVAKSTWGTLKLRYR